MEFKDLLLNNRLEIGKQAYLDFEVGVYLGKDEEGFHQLEYEYQGEKKLKETKYIPTVPQLPLNIYLKNKSSGEFSQIVDYVNFNDKMFYVVKEYSNVFSNNTKKTLHDLIVNYNVLEQSPFKDYKEIDEQITKIDKELEELRKKTNELKSLRKEVTKYCKHEWYKYEPTEVSPKTFEQECRCEYCGEEKINRFNRW